MTGGTGIDGGTGRPRQDAVNQMVREALDKGTECFAAIADPNSEREFISYVRCRQSWHTTDPLGLKCQQLK